jgi:hypothetical protein
MRIRTVAARRTDPQPLIGGSGRRAPDGARLRRRRVRPAAPRASARRRCPLRAARAFGRWRCRWSSPLLLVALLRVVAGIGRRASRFRPSRGGWSCARCSVVRVARAAASRRAMTVSRCGRTRSSATCSGSGMRPAPGATRVRSSSWSWARAGDGLGRDPGWPGGAGAVRARASQERAALARRPAGRRRCRSRARARRARLVVAHPDRAARRASADGRGAARRPAACTRLAGP